MNIVDARLKLPLLCLASVLFLTGCRDMSTSAPEPGEPELIHSREDLVLTPFLMERETLYVRNAPAAEWKVALLDAPRGTTLSGTEITYQIEEGMEGPQEMRAVAKHLDGRILEADWSVIALPRRNQPPQMQMKAAPPTWIVSGTPLRIIIVFTDTEGDPLSFTADLPQGARFHDSILEWTPAPSQTGEFNLLVVAHDGKGNSTPAKHRITVSSFDPFSFTADLSVGRCWWIKGHSVLAKGEEKDSVDLRRKVRILSHDAATGEFSFEMTDTLTTDSVAFRRTVHNGRLRAGVGYEFGSDAIQLPQATPFGIRWFGFLKEEKAITIDGKSYPGVRLLDPNSCLNPHAPRAGCGESEDSFAKGWGRVFSESSGYMSNTYIRYNDSFAVWAVAAP